MEYKYLDGTYRYKEYESAVKAKNLVPYKDADGKGLTLETGHTVYIRNTQNLSNTPSASDSDSDSTESDIGEQITITDEYVESSSGYIDENGNYVETPASTNTGNDAALYSDGALQKCIVSGEEVYDIDNLTKKSNTLQISHSFARKVLASASTSTRRKKATTRLSRTARTGRLSCKERWTRRFAA